MTPQEFLNTIVRLNVADFHREYGSLRHAYNAVAAVDALTAHIYVWCKINAPAHINGITDDTAYRAALARQNQRFSLLRDIAKAQKHVHLDRGNPQVQQAAQITARHTGYGEARYGEARYGGVDQVIVDISPGNFEYVESVVDGALGFLEQEMANLGV